MTLVARVSAQSEMTLPQALGRLRVALDEAFLRASRGLNLTPQQAELLCAALVPTPVGDLAATLRCDRSNVTRLADRAESRGLLTRRTGDEDARVTMIEVTPEGERLARRFLAALESQTASLRAHWPAQRERLTVKLLAELADALEAPSRD